MLIAWENEALLVQHQMPNRFEIVMPGLSILAEPPVAVVDANVARDGNRVAAEAYLEFLYTPAARDIEARHFYRPRLPAVAAKYVRQFPAVHTFTVDELFGNWRAAQKKFFANGAIFDQITSGR